MQKFIITHEGRFKYGDVRLHKDLLEGCEICIGGGFYAFDYTANRLLLTGESFDFGPPKWHYIDTLILPSTLCGLTVLYEGEDISRFVNLSYQALPQQ